MTSFGLPWTEWEPVYRAIRADFGYSLDADEAARDELRASIGSDGLTPHDLPDATGVTVAVAGGAPMTPADFEITAAADLVFGVSTASGRIRKAGLTVDFHVTDLDKDEAVVTELTSSGVPVAVHAHGDNRTAIEQLVPTLDSSAIFPTTQAHPVTGVFNPGGFTDGDRAAFLADALGASRLTFPGWDLEDETVGTEKRRKLSWASRLLRWLEIRRDERFELLDSRRDGIALPPGAALSRED